MSSLGRRKVLYRRRARREKLRKLRQRYVAATTEAERSQILERVARVAPSVSIDEFLSQSKKAS